MKLLPSGRVLCTPYKHAPCHFMQSHIRKVYACLAVNCHLHFWQKDRGLLRATAVTRGWNGYRNKSQHRKLTMEKILPPLLQGFEPATFLSRVRCSNHQFVSTLTLQLLLFGPAGMFGSYLVELGDEQSPYHHVDVTTGSSATVCAPQAGVSQVALHVKHRSCCKNEPTATHSKHNTRLSLL